MGERPENKHKSVAFVLQLHTRTPINFNKGTTNRTDSQQIRGYEALFLPQSDALALQCQLCPPPVRFLPHSSKPPMPSRAATMPTCAGHGQQPSPADLFAATPPPSSTGLWRPPPSSALRSGAPTGGSQPSVLRGRALLEGATLIAMQVLVLRCGSDPFYGFATASCWK